MFCLRDSERGNPLPPHGLLFLNKQGRKEMFYLTTHSTYFILWLYGIRHMVNDQSDSERGSLLPRKSSIVCSTCREERPPNDGTLTNYIFKRHAQYILFYGYMASDMWLWTIQIVREEACCPGSLRSSAQLAGKRGHLITDVNKLYF